jgi:hypothetical protein
MNIKVIIFGYEWGGLDFLPLAGLHIFLGIYSLTILFFKRILIFSKRK